MASSLQKPPGALWVVLVHADQNKVHEVHDWYEREDRALAEAERVAKLVPALTVYVARVEWQS